MGTPLSDLRHRVHRDTVAREELRRPGRRVDREAEVGEAADRQHDRALVAVADADEQVARARQPRVRRLFRLRERHAERTIDPHHLAGRFHLRSEQRVDAGEPAEGQDGFLDGDVVGFGRHVAVRKNAGGSQRGERFAGLYACGRLRELDAGRLGHERHGPGRPRVRLQHVEHAGRQRVLHVQQPAHAHPGGDPGRGLADPVDVGAAQRDRRQRARGVAGVDAGLLDVLHHAADVDVRPVAERVDVDLDRVFEEPVDQDRMRRGDLGGGLDVTREHRVVVHDLHRTAAEHIARPDQHRIPDPRGRFLRLVEARRDPPRRVRQLQFGEQRAETPPVLGDVDSIGRGPEDPDAGGFQRARELQRRLPAELHHHADRLLRIDDLHHVLERERLDVQPVRCVVVGRDGLRVAVDHHDVVAGVAQREARVDAAVVELDPLPDPVRPGAQDDDRRLPVGRDLRLVFVGGVEVRRLRFELGRAGVDGLVHGAQTP